MDDGQLRSVTLGVAELMARLERLLEQSPDAVLAFDGDGTLWSGDVGEDVFHYAVSRQLLRVEAEHSLREETRRHGLSPGGTASELALRLFQAYLAGSYPERDVCGMMSWCYAGMTRAEMHELTESALSATHFESRLHRELGPFLAFARTHELPAIVVSASPQPIVQTAAAAWDIPATHIVASRAAQDGDRILPRLAGPVPYAEGKPTALRGLVGDRTLLAAFGDNVFDIELLQSAALGVAVRPKPALRARLASLNGLVLLE